MRYMKEDFDFKCRKGLHMVIGKTKNTGGETKGGKNWD